jgi:hypothetical protein
MGLCILTLFLSFPAEAQQPAPQPLPFTFKVGQSVWLESHEFPYQFTGILLRVMALGDSMKPGAIAISQRGPIWACGDMEEILSVGSTFRFIPPMPRPAEGAGPQKTVPAVPRTERPPLEASLVTAPVWHVLPAPLVKKALEAGFKKQKKFKIADSAETADFIFWVLAVPAFELGSGRATDRNAPLLSSALAIAIPREQLSRKQAEFKVLADPPTEHAGSSLPQKQRQLYDLMKDVPWEGAALGLGGGFALKEGYSELSLIDLIRCFHKEARKR